MRLFLTRRNLSMLLELYALRQLSEQLGIEEDIPGDPEIAPAGDNDRKDKPDPPRQPEGTGDIPAAVREELGWPHNLNHVVKDGDTYKTLVKKYVNITTTSAREKSRESGRAIEELQADAAANISFALEDDQGPLRSRENPRDIAHLNYEIPGSNIGIISNPDLDVYVVYEWTPRADQVQRGDVEIPSSPVTPRAPSQTSPRRPDQAGQPPRQPSREQPDITPDAPRDEPSRLERGLGFDNYLGYRVSITSDGSLKLLNLDTLTEFTYDLQAQLFPRTWTKLQINEIVISADRQTVEISVLNKSAEYSRDMMQAYLDDVGNETIDGGTVAGRKVQFFKTSETPAVS